jgi:hypothetical protein
MLHQGISHRVGPMLGLEHHDFILVACQSIARFDLHDFDRKLIALDAERDGRAEDPLRSLGPVERDGQGAVLQSHGAEESRDTEQVVGVIVTKEDLAEGKPDAVPHHLALVSFPAVEEERLAFALHRQAGNVPVDSRGRGARSEEGDA